MTAVDRANANDIGATLQAAGDSNNIDPAMFAAVGVREIGFQDTRQSRDDLSHKTMCANANGAGIFQLDLSPGTNVDVSVQQVFDPAWAANYAANTLNNNMNTLAGNFPSLAPYPLLQATAASYNLGTNPVTGISGNPNTIAWAHTRSILTELPFCCSRSASSWESV